jgi:ABC-type transport system substrate-binding protein
MLKMKDSRVILTNLVACLIFTSFLLPATAWEHWNTTVANPQTDNLVDYSGSHADRIQIKLFSNELTEWQALEAGQIDMTDWPLDKAHYVAWTQNPLQQDIAVVNTGSEFGMYILDMQMNDELLLQDGTPNPARTAPFGNPMADVWLRRAIACVVNRKQTVEQIVSGGSPPWLGEAMYTPLDSAYGSWQHPQLTPTGALAAYCYVNPDGSANVAKGNQYLDDHGYTMVAGKRTKGGVPFTLEFYYRVDHTYRVNFATLVMQPLLTQAPPNGLGLDVTMIGVTSAAARCYVMAEKKGHIYTGVWGLTSDCDHMYYLFHINNYWHPGRPPNYMYYPGDANKYSIAGGGAYDGRSYGNDLVSYGAPALNFSDPDKTWTEAENVWENPENYWSWQMMTATDATRAQHCAYKAQEFLTYWVCGVPVWADSSYTAFHRRYTGGNNGVSVSPDDGENAYRGSPWKGVVNQEGFGVWSTMSFYDMHPAVMQFGDGTHMTIRWGFRMPPMSLNPIYAEWVWDWYVLNECYDSVIRPDPYTSTDTRWLAASWNVSTWNSPDYGACTKVTFNLRHDVLWSDGIPLTSSDVKFSWGSPTVTGSLSNLLQLKGLPPAYWSSQVAHVLSIATPDPWTAICYFDVLAYFGLYSMSGFNIVLPEHVWKSIIMTGDPLQPWNQLCVVTGGYIIDSTADPAPVGYVNLHKNLLHFHVQTGDPHNRDKPVDVWCNQISNATAGSGNVHWIYPKQGQTGIEVNVTINMQNTYSYEVGPNDTEVYPFTRFILTVNASLYIWNGTGNPCQEINYVENESLILNQEVVSPRDQCLQLPINQLRIKPWWYFIKIDFAVIGLEFSADNSTWLPVASSQNPYFEMKTSYKEYVIVTSRYDILGAYWKPSPPAKPKYQPIPDMRTNVKDQYACGQAFGSRPNYPNWNSVCDVNSDFKIDVKDYYAIAQNGGWIALIP